MKLSIITLSWDNLDYTKEVAVKKLTDVQVNEFGFRGPEITKEKPANMYRIFTIGGSSMYSQNNLDDETIPYHLQKKFDQYELGVKIEVINAGVNGAWSGTEKEMIKIRRSLYIIKNIEKNQRLTKDHIKSIRPAAGLKPKYLKDVFL